ncbi:BolA family protein [Bowmanella sp. JS7-9]|uniref:BolA family protein n=1 Tax=Pseudobowmanella zhangzhouensis TaxID=1537679 RepID=A0ABW1XLZ6_9ALTE|nr:BolA family protein [Bowmanella sp. JS7-9]TBX21845.1 cell division protein BolA [Bowmanella sp. JS7-9]
MQIETIKTLLNEALPLDELIVTGDGSHFQVIAVGECFDGVSRVKKQQMVYQPLNSVIADGSLHALSIKTFTPDQWRRERLFNQPGS